MSDFRDFRNSQILRNPTTWIVAAIGFAYGGYTMLSIRETQRAEGSALQTPWLLTDRVLDVMFGGASQVFFLLCAVWMIAGLLENTSAWVRQPLVIAIYLGLNWLTRYL